MSNDIAISSSLEKLAYKKACHYTNLQPLTIEDHLLKTKKDFYAK